jgi:radical SAM superfamily enzyme YgiQ (UPF0313 family)
MKILLVYPTNPETFWSFKYALKFISKKATNPPLGLLTVASLLPERWRKKLVDMNVTSLKDRDLKWADLVFISAISVQKDSVKNIISRCKKLGVKIVAGGPLFTSNPNEFKHIDHLVLNEAEITLPLFLEDLKNGCAKHIYTSPLWADINSTPVPDWQLIKMKKYSSMNIQYSRGCPYNCEFCDITLLYGRRPRLKDKDRVLRELTSLYLQGWRGGVFFVDDNFIGNKRKLKNEILPAIAKWMNQRKYPFSFITQASIDLSDDDELMRWMVKSGFDTVFVGIETPNKESLEECKKFQNKNRDLIDCVEKIQKSGLQVQGGFIVGFDNDPLSIFERQIEFIQKSKIVTAMVGLLNALHGTKLYQRLEKEHRLLKDNSGNNTDCSINFIPKMNYDTLVNGYRKILKSIYSPKYYYQRVKGFLRNYKPLQGKIFRIRFRDVQAFLKSIVRLGIIGKERVHYWKLLIWTFFRRPRLFPLAVTFAIYGFHYRKVFEKFW